MRKYQPIWIQLKKSGSCKLSAHPALHARIRKAVTKEKWMDMAYKIERDIAGSQAELVITVDTVDKSILLFTLIHPITLGDL